MPDELISAEGARTQQDLRTTRCGSDLHQRPPLSPHPRCHMDAALEAAYDQRNIGEGEKLLARIDSEVRAAIAAH